MPVQVGDTATRTLTVTDAIVRTFAEVSGDTNPLHLDDAYAATTRFGKRIAHGMIAASVISAILGNDLPGQGTIYLSQELKFRAPVFIDDTITATVAVTAYRDDKRIATLRTTCTNQAGETIMDGDAVVIAPA